MFKSIAFCAVFICLVFSSGCTTAEKIHKKDNVVIAGQDVKISSPVTAADTNQNDFSLPLYKFAEKKASYKCISTLPDGRSGYISRCEFYSSKTADEIADWYKLKKMFIRYIDMPDCRKVIISDNKEMTVYPGKGKKAGSTLVMSRNEEKACTELIYTGFRLTSKETKEKLNKAKQ